MHAAVVREPGHPPTYTPHRDPSPGPGRTLVRVSAAPVVPLDLLCATGTSYFGRPAVPYVPGVQGVGVVEQSTSIEAGTRVWFATSAGMSPGDGSLAELCDVADADVVPVVHEVSDEVVAALGLSAVAAWMSLTWRGGMQPGERVLVLGGGGAVGQAAIGAARVLGAGRVVAVCRSAESAARATAAGADEVVALTNDVDDLTAALTAALDGAVDLVVDSVFGPAATAAARLLAPGGRLVNLGGSSSDEATFSSAVLRSRSADVRGYTNNALTPAQRRDALTAVLQHAADGAISVAHELLPLSDIADGWGRQSSGDTPLRLVLRP